VGTGTPIWDIWEPSYITLGARGVAKENWRSRSASDANGSFAVGATPRVTIRNRVFFRMGFCPLKVHGVGLLPYGCVSVCFLESSFLHIRIKGCSSSSLRFLRYWFLFPFVLQGGPALMLVGGLFAVQEFPAG